MRSFDWSATSIGPAKIWPQSLKTAVRILLDCRLPMYLAWGPDYIQFYNDAYLPILGDKHEVALGNSAPIIWSEIWPTIGPMWEKARQGQPIGFDNFRLTINRYGYPEDCYFNFSYSPVPDDSGAVGGILATFAETTEKFLAEKRQAFQLQLADALRDQRGAARVVEAASRLAGEYFSVDRTGFAEIDSQQNIISVERDWTNGRLFSLAGDSWPLDIFGPALTDELAQGKTVIIEDVSPDQRAIPYAQGYASIGVRSTAAVPILEETTLTGLFYLHSGLPRRWPKEEVTLIEEVARRIANAIRRERGEEALQDETRILELLNQTGQYLNSTLDIDSLLQSITDAATELTGAQFGSFFYNGRNANGDAYMLYTLSGAPREAFEKFGHPRATPIFSPTFHGHPPIRSDDITKDPCYGKMAPHYGMPKGHLPVKSYLATSVISKSGEVIGGLFFGHPEPGKFTERTERIIKGIAAQAAVAIDNARLYEKSQMAAEEREVLLANERSARADAERLIRSKDEFLAMLAHELRNPLAPVSSAAEILKMAAHDEQRVRMASEIISRQVGHLSHLINDLMDVSRVTRGLVQLDKECLDIKAIATTSIEQVRSLVEARQHTLITRIDADRASVFGDRTRLVQVIANLLNNAAKYTPTGGTITLTITVRDEQILISVIDNGAGIDGALLPHVFELFTQASRSLDRTLGGLGIGLALVKAIVALHDGSVTAHSDGPGCGSIFTVILPKAGDGMAQPIEKPALPATGSLHIMVVDDNVDAANSIGALLTALGHKVTIKTDATTALAEAKSHPPDAFILDIGLPDLDGYQLARELRGMAACKSALLIALTGYGQPQDRALAETAGFDHHFVKPANTQRLAEVLSSVHAR
ncbi:GAF domain-containing protein [Paucimonas lemoignei]|nr:GAF domain-containing protein [Paucimonas lemoignei]